MLLHRVFLRIKQISQFQLITSIAATSVHSCLFVLRQNNQERAHAIIAPAYYISNKHYTSILTEEQLATLLYVIQKGKFVPVHATRHAVEVQSHSFLTSAFRWRWWLASGPGPPNFWIGAGFNVSRKEKIYCPCQESNPISSSP
jgi:hypothetical protein